MCFPAYFLRAFVGLSDENEFQHRAEETECLLDIGPKYQTTKNESNNNSHNSRD